MSKIEYVPRNFKASSMEIIELADQICRRYAALIIHLGDHDPSGVDMTRDIEDRLSMFTDSVVEVRRIALNMDQIAEFNPPPNPAKLSDGRAKKYIAEYGPSSWELDALKPEQLITLIKREVDRELDVELFNEQVDKETEGRAAFDKIADRWDELQQYLDDNPLDD